MLHQKWIQWRRLELYNNSHSNNIVEVHNLYKTYTNEVEIEVLKNINLKIKKGEFVAIVGPSGSGKSTLMNMIGILDTPTSGEVLINGVKVTSLKEKEKAEIRNQELGFVFQYHHLLPEFTAMENVMIPLRINGVNKKKASIIARDLLGKVGLADRLNHKPTQLSGGENQRVAIARALANSPSIVIGDEPTGNLDTKSTNRIYELLRTLNKKHGQTFIIVTHNEQMAKKADRIIQLVDGEIIGDSE
ncbi:MAG: ABC transporter ATP-binding protein, partial [Methanosarcinales archaeon]